MNRSRAALAFGLVLLIAAAAVTFFLADALGIGGGGLASGGPAEDHSPDTATPAANAGAPEPTPSSRTGALCVDALSVSSPLADEQTIEEAVRLDAAAAANEGLASDLWRPLDWGEVTVTAGCPSAPLPLTMGGTWLLGRPDRAPPSVEKPSGYSLFIFVMPLDDIDRLLGGTEVRRTSQEFQCIGDTCSPKSSAMYITAEEAAAGRESLQRIIEEGVGLRSAH